MAMHKSIGYHTRLCADNNRKIVGGSFGGGLDMETANRLVNIQFNVVVKNSGRAVFMDREGREVMLYVTVDPEMTDKGQAAIRQWQAERAERERAEALKEAEVQTLLDSMTTDEALRRLKAPYDPT